MARSLPAVATAVALLALACAHGGEEVVNSECRIELRAKHQGPPGPLVRETGFVARIYSYGDVDAVVNGLLTWIQRNDLSIDVVLHVVPSTEVECEEACDG